MASRLRHTLAGLTQDPLHWTCSRNARLTGRKESDPLSRYAITADGGLVVTWPTAAADEAAVLTTLPAGPQSGQLALALTDLSEQLWRCYTHPATAAPDDDDLNSEQSRRRADRAAIELVPGIVGLTGPTGHEDAGLRRAPRPANRPGPRGRRRHHLQRQISWCSDTAWLGCRSSRGWRGCVRRWRGRRGRHR